MFPGRARTSGAIQIPLWILVLDDLSIGAKMLYGVLTLLAGGRKAVSNVSVDHIAKYMRTSTRSVQNLTRELERYGLVAREAPYEGEVTNRYVFFDHPTRYRDELMKVWREGEGRGVDPKFKRRDDIRRTVDLEVHDERRARRRGRTR